MKEIEAFKIEVKEAARVLRAVDKHERAKSLEDLAAVAVKAMEDQAKK